MRSIIITLLILINITSFSQLKGKVIDQQTNQPIVGATISVDGKPLKVSNSSGDFTLDNSIKSIIVSSIGYSSKTFNISNDNFQVLLTASNVSLNEVLIQGNGTGNKLLKAPDAIGLITNKDLERTNGVFLHQSLNLLPGVKMEMRNNTQGARIVLRGYGNETNFNGAGYKAYLNGIPVTDPDGTTFLDDIDFANLGRVEVIKGPSSSLYGNAIGGVVLMQLQKATPGETTLSQNLLFGKDKLLRTNTSYKTATDNSNLFVNYGHQTYDGYRMHGSSKKDFFNLGGDFYQGKRTITVFGSYASGFDYLPGQVDSFNLYNHPDSSSKDYVANDAHVNIENFKLSIGQEYKYNDLFANNSSIFLVSTYLDQPSAAGLSRSNKYKLGARTAFTYSLILGTIPVKFSLGAEYIKSKNFAKSYTLINNVLGGLRADQEIAAQQYNVFFQSDIHITPTTTISAGAGQNYLEYDIADQRATTYNNANPPTATYINQSVYKKFAPIFAPRLAITQMLGEHVSVYGNISKGFSSPSTGQITIIPPAPGNPSVNTDLKPEIATDYEVGSKGSLLHKNLSYDIAIFRMDVQDKLVVQFPTAAYSITTNAGKVKHQGVELSTSYAWNIEKSFISLVKPFISYTYSDFKYVDFKTIPSDPAQQNASPNQKVPVDFSGKTIEGTPKNLFNAGFDIETNIGLYVNNTFNYIDKIALDFANLHYAKSYTIFNSKIGFKKLISKHVDLNVFAGMDNIGNTHYASHIFLNSRDYPKVYNPMPLSNWYFGINFKYIL